MRLSLARRYRAGARDKRARRGRRKLSAAHLPQAPSRARAAREDLAISIKRARGGGRGEFGRERRIALTRWRANERTSDINVAGSPLHRRGRGDCARDIRQECAHLPFPANGLLN